MVWRVDKASTSREATAEELRKLGLPSALIDGELPTESTAPDEIRKKSGTRMRTVVAQSARPEEDFDTDSFFGSEAALPESTPPSSKTNLDTDAKNCLNSMCLRECRSGTYENLSAAQAAKAIYIGIRLFTEYRWALSPAIQSRDTGSPTFRNYH